MRTKAKAEFVPLDIQIYANEQLGMNITLDQAREWLHNHRHIIEDDMIERGWHSIETLMEEQDFDVKLRNSL